MISNFEEIFQKYTCNGMREMTEERFIQATKEVWNAAIEEMDLEQFEKKLLERFGFMDDTDGDEKKAIDVIGQLKIFSFMEWLKDSILNLKIK